VAGLLIVNADDWGVDAPTTEAIAECFAAARITSATGMVYMADSEHAAGLARSRGLPIGLHLNLTEPFDAPGVPRDVRERQLALTRRFRHLRFRRWTYDPFAGGAIERAIADQLDRFRVLYGREPTHVDGHHHVQVCPDVMTRLPRGIRIRTTRSIPGAPLSPTRLARRLKEAAIRRRFAAPEYFFSLRALSPAFGGSGLESALALADSTAVEIMVHPGLADERRLLLSGAWRLGLEDRPLGSFESLS